MRQAILSLYFPCPFPIHNYTRPCKKAARTPIGITGRNVNPQCASCRNYTRKCKRRREHGAGITQGNVKENGTAQRRWHAITDGVVKKDCGILGLHVPFIEVFCYTLGADIRRTTEDAQRKRKRGKNDA